MYSDNVSMNFKHVEDVMREKVGVEIFNSIMKKVYNMMKKEWNSGNFPMYFKHVEDVMREKLGDELVTKIMREAYNRSVEEWNKRNMQRHVYTRTAYKKSWWGK